MSGKYVLIAFLAGLTAIVLIVGLGVLAVAFGLKNPDAFALLAAAISGLVVVVSRFIPNREGPE